MWKIKEFCIKLRMWIGGKTSSKLRNGSSEECERIIEFLSGKVREGVRLSQDYISGVLHVIKRPDIKPIVRISAMEILEKLDPERLQECLPELLDSSDVEVRSSARQMLNRLS